MIVNGISKPDECKRPQADSCRGCPHSFAPELYDGGCRLQGGAQDQEDTEENTPPADAEE